MPDVIDANPTSEERQSSVGISFCSSLQITFRDLRFKTFNEGLNTYDLDTTHDKGLPILPITVFYLLHGDIFDHHG